MKAKRVLLALLFSGVLLLLCLWLVGPTLARLALQKALASSFGGTCTVERFSFSIEPLHLSLSGLKVRMGENSTLSLNSLNATGRFKGHTLIVDHLEVGNLHLTLWGSLNLPPPSVAGRTALALTKTFLFNKVRLIHAGFEGGIVEGRGYRLVLKDWDVSQENGTKVVGKIKAGSGQGEFVLPEVEILLPSNVPFGLPMGVSFKIADAKGRLIGATGRFDASGRVTLGSAVEIESLRVALRALRFKERPLPNTLLTLRGRLNAAKGIARLEPLNLSVKGRGNLTVSVKLSNTPEGKHLEAMVSTLSLMGRTLRGIGMNLSTSPDGLSVTLQGENTGLLKLLGLVPSLEGIKLSGDESLLLRAELRQNRLSFEGRFETEGLSFQSGNSQAMGEGLSLRMALNGTGDPSHFSLGITLHVPRGEVLFGNLYLDLKNNPLHLLSQLEFTPDRTQVKISRVSCALQGLFKVEGDSRLRLNPLSVKAGIRLVPTPLSPLLHTFLVEPMKDEYPILTEIKVGGVVSSTAQVRLVPKGWEVKGRIRWQKGELLLGTLKDEPLKKANLNLPFWIARGVSSKGKSIKGKITIGALKLPLLESESLSLALAAHPNRLVVQGTSLHLLGGELRLAPTTLRFGDKTFGLKTSVKLKAIRLSELLKLPEGEDVLLGGGPLRISFSGKHLATSGELLLRGFGGEVHIWGIEADNLFSPAPVFKLNARWEGIDLERLTKGTSFGKITGRLAGRIEGLQVAYGQPQAFDLLIESVPTKGVSQRISVKAVENIAELSGSGSPFVGLAGTVASVLNSFPYSKIGVRATLKNDQFRIWGTAQKGSQRYLVRRGLWGVDVVVQDPGSPVGFQEMVRRIRAVMTSRESPVIR